MSLIHQLEVGLKKGYSEEEVVEAVIRAVQPGLTVRSYLKICRPLTLPNLRQILRFLYHEKDSTELYQLLSSATQGTKETPQDFLIRLLELRQHILFASKEADSQIKYDPGRLQPMNDAPCPSIWANYSVSIIGQS